MIEITCHLLTKTKVHQLLSVQMNQTPGLYAGLGVYPVPGFYPKFYRTHVRTPKHVRVSTLTYPGQTIHSLAGITVGSVNEYHLRPERQRQVWFRWRMNAGCAGKTARTHATPERLRGVFTTGRYTNPRLPLHYCQSVSRFPDDPADRIYYIGLW